MHLAVDPGKRAGWALCDGEDCVQSGVVDGDDPRQASVLLAELRPPLVVLEDQHHGPVRGRVQPAWKSIKTLLRRRYIWEILAELGQAAVVDVNPATWQSHWRIRRGDKDAMVRLARTVTRRVIDYDEADAVLIGLWYEEQM